MLHTSSASAWGGGEVGSEGGGGRQGEGGREGQIVVCHSIPQVLYNLWPYKSHFISLFLTQLHPPAPLIYHFSILSLSFCSPLPFSPSLSLSPLPLNFSLPLFLSSSYPPSILPSLPSLPYPLSQQEHMHRATWSGGISSSDEQQVVVIVVDIATAGNLVDGHSLEDSLRGRNKEG